MTYPELLAQIAGYLNRDDLTDQIPIFVSLAESRMQREMRGWWGVAPSLHGGTEVDEAIVIAPLSVGAPTNWLIDHAPDAYLYGALIHSAPYLVEDARLETWGALYRSAMEDLRRENEMAKHPGLLVMRKEIDNA